MNWTKGPTISTRPRWQLTTVDVGNDATNVIPATARAGLNIRFNDLHSGTKPVGLVCTRWRRKKAPELAWRWSLRSVFPARRS